MELNIVNEYPFTFKEEERFQTILDTITKILDMKQQYVLSVIFCDHLKVHDINLKFRNIDRTTDVISFALLDEQEMIGMDDDAIELGDIFINIDACKQQAIEYEHTFERELCFLFTHGVLHLLGYDHMVDADEKVMIGLQKEILDGLI